MSRNECCNCIFSTANIVSDLQNCQLSTVNCPLLCSLFHNKDIEYWAVKNVKQRLLVGQNLLYRGFLY
jgi:hypothetical protein